MKKYLLATLLLAAMSSIQAATTVRIVGLYGTTYCAGATFPVVIRVIGIFQFYNVFSAQLSDASGRFSSAVTIGTDSTYLRGLDTIMVTIPAGMPSGSAYRVRILSTTPDSIWPDNGENLIIQATPPAPVVTQGGGCPDTLYISGQGDPYSITWRQEASGCICQDSTFPAAYTPSIVAGGNGLGSAADQLYPDGVYVYGGNIYVSDVNNARVQRFPVGSTSATNGVTVAGGNGTGADSNQIYGPDAVFVDGAGYLYVSDYSNGRVMKFPPGSTSATDGVTIAGGNGLGSGPDQLWSPQGLFVDGCGNLYVADYDNARIQMFPAGSTSATNGVTVAGGNGNGAAANQLSAPYAVFVDNAGYIYVADDGNNRIQKFPPGSDTSTAAVTVAGGNGNGNAPNQMYPSGVWVDAPGNIYVVDGSLNRIAIFPPWSNSGTYGMILGSGQGGNIDQMQGPIGIFVDSAGNIYVADNGNQRVVAWTPAPSPTSYVPYTTAATYDIQYTTWAGCWSATDTVIEKICTGINTINDQNTLSLYPNPNNGSFVLQSTNDIGKDYIITDMLGRVVAGQTITSDNQSISLQNITAGSYILSVKGSSGNTVRFVVE